MGIELDIIRDPNGMEAEQEPMDDGAGCGERSAL